MAMCVIKNKCNLPLKIHISNATSKSDYIIHPHARITIGDLAGSTLSLDTKVNILTRRKIGTCIPRTVKKKVNNVDSIDIITYISKITISN